MPKNINKRIIAIVGMAGSGKSMVASYFHGKGIPAIRFGEIIVSEVARRGLQLTPNNERLVREDIRARYGMDAVAKLALPHIRECLESNQIVVIDGLYSFSEYKTLREEFNDKLAVIAVFTPKHERYRRLSIRKERPLSIAEAEERDFLEIERIEKGGPIAIADFTIINDSSEADLYRKIEDILKYILGGAV
jgi:dephospho-CoA kinase